MSSTMNNGQFAFRELELISKISIQLKKHTKQVVKFYERSTAGIPRKWEKFPDQSNLENVF